ncbi:glycosyltransferase [Pseudoalteromonas luteoviolacea]|uniref:Uncharacterized protein n=1 Tax=Pseudoalteromonas luteoviolacea NCIMB 1942 TaxID=1365253 RepID=A0A166ZIY7_9GAMM|nr:glycosyltransferase [Pseudoalteromonas luteoviolacea]KZN44361.1 hypothetical protein N482_16470 [Pseudoalteromonas luteoviolacea NCIMB 1942]
MSAKTAIICNSNNPDLAMYFSKKVKCFRDEAYFLANKEIANNLNIGCSSVSKVSGLSFGLIIDSFLAFIVVFKLLFNRVNTVVFDTAHISNLPLAVLCKICGIKLVFTIHDWNPHEGKQQKNVLLYNKFVDKVLANAYITFSKVNTDTKVYQLRLSGFEKQSPAQPDGYYLFFGRIEPYKGLRHLVSIAKAMHEKGLPEKIIVAGRGEDNSIDELEALPNVEVINRFISDQELDGLLKGAIATLLPYDSATQSGVILHSYSYSKPVVAFDVGALHEYINDGVSGILVEHGNTSLFTEKMHYINENYDFFMSGVESEFKEFDDNALERQYKALLESLKR